MNSDKLANLIGILANVTVVAGLVILIIQVDQANRLAEADAAQRRASEIQESLQQFALSDYLPAIYSKASEEGFGALSLGEKSRVQAWESARLFRMQGQYRQYQLGMLDRDSIEAMLNAAAWYSKHYWEPLQVPVTDREFLEAINQVTAIRPQGALEIPESLDGAN